MKIILISVGTRGDIEPFLSIAGMLKEKGHQVICAFPDLSFSYLWRYLGYITFGIVKDGLPHRGGELAGKWLQLVRPGRS